jgi:hypothetical protein
MPVKSKKLNIAITVPVKKYRIHSTRAVPEQSPGNTSNRTSVVKTQSMYIARTVPVTSQPMYRASRVLGRN